MMPPPSNAAGSTFRLGGTLTIPRLGLGRCSYRADATGPPSITPRRWRSRATARPDRGDGGRARPDQLCPAVEQNLRELGVDVLDLVYLRVGRLSAMGADPIGERFAALAELRDEGLIRHLRISNVTRSPVAAARLMLDDADLALPTRGGRKQDAPGWHLPSSKLCTDRDNGGDKAPGSCGRQPT
jgi:Aldo/keto reductase family